MKIRDLLEVSHKVGMAADRALASKSVTSQQQQKYMHKFKQLQAQQQELAARPDSHTGKYAKQFQNIERQKIKAARAGNLNALGEPIMETATSGATSSGNIATVAQAGQPVQRRPSLFGYVPVKIGTKNKKKRAANK